MCEAIKTRSKTACKTIKAHVRLKLTELVTRTGVICNVFRQHDCAVPA